MELKLKVSWHCEGKLYSYQVFYFLNCCLTFAISSQKQKYRYWALLSVQVLSPFAETTC